MKKEEEELIDHLTAPEVSLVIDYLTDSAAAGTDIAADLLRSMADSLKEASEERAAQYRAEARPVHYWPSS